MCALLEKAKETTGLSYYGIAKKLDVSMQLMNRWKNNKGQPNGINSLKLTAMAKIEPIEAVKLLENGFISLSLLIVTGFSCALTLALFSMRQVCILCKIKPQLFNTHQA